MLKAQKLIIFKMQEMTLELVLLLLLTENTSAMLYPRENNHPRVDNFRFSSRMKAVLVYYPTCR